ncbi:MAG: hypothetical protein ACXWV2_07835 [Chitinophagaceae bacterium]
MILLLQMINLSINPPDFRQLSGRFNSQDQGISLNEIESIYELVAEGFFYENVPDSEDQDTDASFILLDLFSFTQGHSATIVIPHTIQLISYYQSGTSLIYPQPDTPPPRQA